MDPTRRKFYIITIAVFLVIVLFATAIIVYTEDSYVKIEVTGTAHAYFVLSYDSTSATIPVSQNITVEVLPHVNLTISAYPDALYNVSSWNTSGAQVLRMGNDTISLMTPPGRGYRQGLARSVGEISGFCLRR
jgi:preprotein translocase subunit SecY